MMRRQKQNLHPNQLPEWLLRKVEPVKYTGHLDPEDGSKLMEPFTFDDLLPRLQWIEKNQKTYKEYCKKKHPWQYVKTTVEQDIQSLIATNEAILNRPRSGMFNIEHPSMFEAMSSGDSMQIMNNGAKAFQGQIDAHKATSLSPIKFF